MPSRIVVVSGMGGVGKSATLHAMVDVLDDVAALETDRFYMMFDPEWKLDGSDTQPYWDRGMMLVRRTVGAFVERGTELVAVASNGIQHSFLARAFARSMPDGVPVHHVTLDPGADAVRARLAQRWPDRELHWVDDELAWFRERYGRWTYVIDNATMTPDETAKTIAEVVSSGAPLLEDSASYFEACEPIRSPDTAIELMLACGRAKTNSLLIDSTLLNDDFLDLSTGFAGELLQKFVNYQIRVAMVFYAGITYTPSFERFLAEAKGGREMRAFTTHDAAVDWLAS